MDCRDPGHKDVLKLCHPWLLGPGNPLVPFGNARATPITNANIAFFNAPLLLLADVKHSQQEPRFHALGRTHQDRLLHITFTLRRQNTHIRVISARDMHKKERSIYEQAP
ncbi:BrnT family toxin [Methylomonas koyamae]|uniref:BrnT family toxin n=1 Tax=Methylomonas koyamae TaxID=702114 RepID=UPI0009ED5C25